MIIPSFDEIDNVSDSRYSLVLLVAKRTRELIDEKDERIENSAQNPVSIAIEEAINGEIPIQENTLEEALFFANEFDSDKYYDFDEDLFSTDLLSSDDEFIETEE